MFSTRAAGFLARTSTRAAMFAAAVVWSPSVLGRVADAVDEQVGAGAERRGASDASRLSARTNDTSAAVNSFGVVADSRPVTSTRQPLLASRSAIARPTTPVPAEDERATHAVEPT
jgi:hypothetical protein